MTRNKPPAELENRSSRATPDLLHASSMRIRVEFLIYRVLTLDETLPGKNVLSSGWNYRHYTLFLPEHAARETNS